MSPTRYPLRHSANLLKVSKHYCNVNAKRATSMLSLLLFLLCLMAVVCLRVFACVCGIVCMGVCSGSVGDRRLFSTLFRTPRAR